MNLKKNKILIIGVMHAAQDLGHFERRIGGLRKNFSADFVKNESDNLLKMRAEMLGLIERLNPDFVIEECGPYKKVPGDTWKAMTGSQATILEKKYPDRHIFIDARLEPSGDKPSLEKREREMLNSIKKIIKKNSEARVVLVIGASHIESMGDLLDGARLSFESKNLKNKFFSNIKELLAKEKNAKV